MEGYVFSEALFEIACQEFWNTYYQSMLELHARRKRRLHEPLKDRNLGTTDSKHVAVFETFWQVELARALNVPVSEVGMRSIQFRPHRSKSFDVCWPLYGEPKILISCKSMQNAYRNFTNRIEEAFGDSAVLRLYRSNAAFGFFFFMVDGNVPRGIAEQGRMGVGDAVSGKGKGVSPFLDLVEHGGDFFNLSRVDDYRKSSTGRAKGRQDVIEKAELSLLDLVATEPSSNSGIHYDSIAFVPTRLSTESTTPAQQDWKCEFSPVNDLLSYRTLIPRLLEAAKLRGLL